MLELTVLLVESYELWFKTKNSLHSPPAEAETHPTPDTLEGRQLHTPTIQ